MARINTLAADQWHEVVVKSDVFSDVREHHATTGGGAKVVIKGSIQRDDSADRYELTVDDQLIAYYQTDGYNTFGRKDVATLFRNVEKLVKDWRAVKNGPEREAREAKCLQEARRAADEEKKRQSMLRRL